MEKMPLLALLFAFALILGCARNAPETPVLPPAMNISPQANGSVPATLDSDACAVMGGRIANTLSGGCWENETSAGDVEGLRCPCVCCIQKE